MTAALWYLVVYSFVVGAGMLGFWAVAVATRQVPEIEEGSTEIWFHITAETVTALTLVAGGIATLAAPETDWAPILRALGVGLVVYTLIQSPGYYVERREWAPVGMFAGFWLLTVPAIVLLFT